MEKRKSTRYKHVKRAAFDISFTLVCLAGAALGLWLFWTDLNRVLVKKAEEPVGLVTYKRHSVQRRFEDRLFWAQLPRESPVYNGDLVRTSGFSDAAIRFVSEDSISLAENTLIHILYDKESGTRIELISGEVSLSSLSGSMVILTGLHELRPGAGAVLTASREQGETAVRAIRGSTRISGAGGFYDLEEGGAANSIGEEGFAVTGSIVAASPLPNEELTAGVNPMPVNFSWTGGEIPPGLYVRFEVAADRRFSTVYYSSDEYEAGENGVMETVVLLSPGVWWWRAFLARLGSADPVGESRANRLVIYGPEEEKAAVSLAPPLALAALSAELPLTGMEAPLPVETPPRFEVPAAAPAAPAAPAAQSAPAGPALLPRPAGLYPADQTVIDGAYLTRNLTIVFSWNRVNGANAYLFTLRQGANVSLNLIREPHFEFGQLGSLGNGLCAWQVEAVLLAGDGSIQRHGEPAESRLIISVPRPAAPALDNPGIIYGQ
jgi:hypothetical protein